MNYMKKLNLFGALAAAAVAIVACTGQAGQKPQGLVIEKQGVFSSGGRVTEAIPGEYDPTQNWLDQERKGTTTHVDHANTMYQIPAGGSGTPMVFLHGYGQTRTGWQSTPDGREGWSDLFLKKGYSVFLVDQPRRGAAGATEEIVNDPSDVANGKFKVGEQAWYTHFRIGRVAPERYEGSQFPEGDDALEEFFCQMTPNTGNYDEPLFGKALSAVLKDVQTITGKKSIYVTHSQGGRVGWATDTDNMAAIIAVEPGLPRWAATPTRNSWPQRCPCYSSLVTTSKMALRTSSQQAFGRWCSSSAATSPSSIMPTEAMPWSSTCPTRTSTATATSCSRRRTMLRLLT